MVSDALDLPGSRDAFATRPVLEPHRLALLGTDPVEATDFERAQGPTLDQLATALKTVVADPRRRALSIGEINPTRTAGAPEELNRLVAVLADVLRRTARG